MKPREHYRLSEQYLAAANKLAMWERPTNERHPRRDGEGEEFAELMMLANVHASLAQYPEASPPPPVAECPRRYVWSFKLARPKRPLFEIGHHVWPPLSPVAESSGAVKWKGVDAMTQLQDNQQLPLSVEAEDAAGNAVTDTGTRVWALDNPALASLVDNGDGSQTLVAVGPVGTVTVTVTDTEPSPDGGVTPGSVFQGSIAVDIVSGPVHEIVINAGAPVDKPVPGDPTTGGPTPAESAPTTS